MRAFEGKVIAVTGAASGIGRSTALLLAERGAVLSLADTDQSGLDKTVKLILDENTKVKTFVVDVRKSSEVTRWIEDTVATFGKLYGAANVAGVYRPISLAKCTDDDWDFSLEVNARGVFNCLRAQIANIEHGGSIVNVASIAGIEGLGFAPIYAASKHAAVGLSKSVAREQAPRNIRVNIVAPGSIHTPLLEEAMKDRGGAKNAIHKGNGMERVADPMEIANVIGFLLSSESSFVTGAVFTADGGLTAGQ